MTNQDKQTYEDLLLAESDNRHLHHTLSQTKNQAANELLKLRDYARDAIEAMQMATKALARDDHERTMNAIGAATRRLQLLSDHAECAANIIRK